mmetsp:Transcript_26904/g.62483  ORF Transcript_26904/g.62483 Transcript_26904/m.62483 type:complete len:471 (-) Transcript_26904:183-1595(-)
MDFMHCGQRFAQTLNTYVLPVSAVVLCLYPPVLFLRMLTAGLVRPAERDNLVMPEREQRDLSRPGCTVCAAIMAAAPLLLLPGLGFSLAPIQPEGEMLIARGAVGSAQLPVDAVPRNMSRSVCGSICCLAGVAIVAIAFKSLVQTVTRARAERLADRRKRKLGRNPIGLLHKCRAKDAPEKNLHSAWYLPPEDTGTSWWHKIDLFVTDWLDEDTGLYRYINEMPKGCLQKFELQTQLENNVIREDSKGSARLQSFGVPVPFNYGCFPQTYRDPLEHDELHDAPGDDDPLDVIDIGQIPVGVGDVVVCRPLGAVCLIDEGQADWKIFVVAAQSEGPFTALHSMADVESMWPGRVQEILKWMDDFKQHSCRGRTKLHYEVHGASVAISLIKKDHLSWRRLISRADAGGRAGPHWISKPSGAHPEVLQVAWQPSHGSFALTGATTRHLSVHPQASRGSAASSDGETSSSDRSP